MTIYKDNGKRPFKIGIVSNIEIRSGITRAVSTIAHYFINNSVLINTGRKIYQEFYDEFPENVLLISSPSFFCHKSMLFLQVLLNAFFIWIICMVKNINILNSHGLSNGEIISSSLAKLFSFGMIKNVIFIYDVEEVDTIRTKSLLYLLIKIFIKLRLIDLIIVLDRRMKNYVKNKLSVENVNIIRIGLHPNIIHNRSSINCENIKIKVSYFNKPEITSIFFHGILIPRRRLEDLITALYTIRKNTMLNNFILYISGSLEFDTSYVNYIKDLIQRLNLENNVKFLGKLSDIELSCMYMYIDIFVWPCDSQTWGLAPLEAMFFGKPIIVTSGTGISEILNKQIAIVVPPRDPEAIASALKSLLTDQNYRNEMGKKASEFVKRHFTYQNTGKALERLFNLILNS